MRPRHVLVGVVVVVIEAVAFSRSPTGEILRRMAVEHERHRTDSSA